jgi:hypothetical protein
MGYPNVDGKMILKCNSAVQDKVMWQALPNTVMSLRALGNAWGFLLYRQIINLFYKECAPWY